MDNKLKIASTVAAVIVGAGVGYTVYPTAASDIEASTVHSSFMSSVLSVADAECISVIKLVGDNPSCSRGRTHLGDSSEWTEGWACNGAWMPDKVQKCLDEAASKLRGLSNRGRP